MKPRGRPPFTRHKSRELRRLLKLAGSLAIVARTVGVTRQSACLWEDVPERHRPKLERAYGDSWTGDPSC